MAVVCRHQYEHPLLWCDDRRRAEERKIANESFLAAKQRATDNELEKQREINEVSLAVITLNRRIIAELIVVGQCCVIGLVNNEMKELCHMAHAMGEKRRGEYRIERIDNRIACRPIEYILLIKKQQRRRQ